MRADIICSGPFRALGKYYMVVEVISKYYTGKEQS